MENGPTLIFIADDNFTYAQTLSKALEQRFAVSLCFEQFETTLRESLEQIINRECILLVNTNLKQTLADKRRDRSGITLVKKLMQQMNQQSRLAIIIMGIDNAQLLNQKFPDVLTSPLVSYIEVPLSLSKLEKQIESAIEKLASSSLDDNRFVQTFESEQIAEELREIKHDFDNAFATCLSQIIRLSKCPEKEREIVVQLLSQLVGRLVENSQTEGNRFHQVKVAVNAAHEKIKRLSQKHQAEFSNLLCDIRLGMTKIDEYFQLFVSNNAENGETLEVANITTKAAETATTIKRVSSRFKEIVTRLEGDGQ